MIAAIRSKKEVSKDFGRIRKETGRCILFSQRNRFCFGELLQHVHYPLYPGKSLLNSIIACKVVFALRNRTDNFFISVSDRVRSTFPSGAGKCF